MQFDKEFKEAISNLPSKEKDKLLFRLLKKDKALANRLYFDLVSGDSVEGRRDDVEKKILRMVEMATNSYYSPGYLMMDIRDASGYINDHVSVTKDKYGDVYLNLLLVKETLRHNVQNIQTATKNRVYKFCLYIINKVFKSIILLKALHEDYYIEFEDTLKEIGQLIGSSEYIMNFAIHNGFDVNWLMSSENIPDDIKKIYQNLRKEGFLK